MGDLWGAVRCESARFPRSSWKLQGFALCSCEIFFTSRRHNPNSRGERQERPTCLSRRRTLPFADACRSAASRRRKHAAARPQRGGKVSHENNTRAAEWRFARPERDVFVPTNSSKTYARPSSDEARRKQQNNGDTSAMQSPSTSLMSMNLFPMNLFRYESISRPTSRSRQRLTGLTVIVIVIPVPPCFALQGK